MFDSVIVNAASLLLGAIFIVAGLQKLRQPSHYATVIADYRLLAEKPPASLAWSLGLLELLAGSALLLPPARVPAAVILALLLLGYALAIAVNIARGRSDIDCGCAGPMQQQSLSTGLVWRNLVLMLAAVLVMLGSSGREPSWLDWFATLATASGGLLFYHIVNQLLANNALLTNLRN